LQGEFEEMAVVGDVSIDEIATNDEDVGVLVFEPSEGRSGENDGLFVADVEIGY